MNFLIDTENLQYIKHGVVRVNRIDMKPSAGYEEITGLFIKPVGRVYYDQYEHLDYTTGEPVEKPIISGGEKGMVDRYLKAGVRVYTHEQVVKLLEAGTFERTPSVTEAVQDAVETLTKAGVLTKNELQRVEARVRKMVVTND